MDNVGDEADFMALLHAELEAGRNNLRQNRANLQRLLAKYAKQMARLKRKSPGENLVSRVWQQKIAERNAMLADVELHLTNSARALEILKDYEAVQEAGAGGGPTPFTLSFTMG